MRLPARLLCPHGGHRPHGGQRASFSLTEADAPPSPSRRTADLLSPCGGWRTSLAPHMPVHLLRLALAEAGAPLSSWRPVRIFALGTAGAPPLSCGCQCTSFARASASAAPLPLGRPGCLLGPRVDWHGSFALGAAGAPPLPHGDRQASFDLALDGTPPFPSERLSEVAAASSWLGESSWLPVGPEV